MRNSQPKACTVATLQCPSPCLLEAHRAEDSNEGDFRGGQWGQATACELQAMEYPPGAPLSIC